jgi:hypothetical protein
MLVLRNSLPFCMDTHTYAWVHFRTYTHTRTHRDTHTYMPWTQSPRGRGVRRGHVPSKFCLSKYNYQLDLYACTQRMNGAAWVDVWLRKTSKYVWWRSKRDSFMYILNAYQWLCVCYSRSFDIHCWYYRFPSRKYSSIKSMFVVPLQTWILWFPSSI